MLKKENQTLKENFSGQLSLAEDRILSLSSDLEVALLKISELESINLKRDQKPKEPEVSQLHYKDKKNQELKTNVKMLEQKLVACNDLLKMNELHKKGKLKTVDFLW